MYWTQQKNVHLQAFGQHIFQVSFNNNDKKIEINNKNKSLLKDLNI